MRHPRVAHPATGTHPVFAIGMSVDSGMISALAKRRSGRASPSDGVRAFYQRERGDMVHRIETSNGQFTDPEFEAIACRFFRRRQLRELPAPAQVEHFLRRHKVTAADHDWARSVSQRALTKVLLSSS